ncbi:MAG: hypothetical protein RR290_02545 [Clostridia bacterium]
MNKQKILWLIIIVIIIAAITFGVYFVFFNPNMFNNNKVIPIQKEVSVKAEYSIIHATGLYDNMSMHGELPAKNISIEQFIIFNKDGKVVDIIAEEKGYNEEQMRIYNESLNFANNSLFYNIKVSGDTIKYNANWYNGKTKVEIKEILAKLNNVVIKEL